MIERLAYWWFRGYGILRWYYRAITRFDVHSPFLSSFLAEVVEDRRYFHAFGLVAQLRNYWKKQRGSVPTLSLGAPSKISQRTERPIYQLVAQSAIPPACGELLFRSALWTQQPLNGQPPPLPCLLELGTNAGISTLYLHFANRHAELHTIEGNPAVAALAAQTFSVARCGRQLQQHTGLFDAVLPNLLPTLKTIDLLFIDGDHTYKGTLAYLRACLPKAKPNSLFIVADIHWSKEMEQAWEEAKQLQGVTASLDLYHFGFLFFQDGLTPHLHLNYIASKWKPWRLGFFA